MTGSHETTTGTTEAAAPTLEPRIAACLRRYRVAAYVVGVGLLCLTVAAILDWGFAMPAAAAVVGPLHGFLYMVYLAVGIDFALKARWSVPGTVGVLLAGTIPFVSFVVERTVTRRVRDGRGV